MTLIEVLSMGLAIIVTDAGFTGDWLQDHETSLIIPGSSSYHLAKAALSLIENKELRCKISRNGQELARLFTFDRLIGRLRICVRQAVPVRLEPQPLSPSPLGDFVSAGMLSVADRDCLGG